MLNRTAVMSLLGAALLLAPWAVSQNLYRYTNAEGTVVVDYQVPPEYVTGGYEVLNEKGVVVKVVPRELTEQERREQDAQRLLEQRALAEEQRLREWDESLLLRYSTIADIEDARERALRELRIRVNILKSNKRSLGQQVENYQAQAADIERRGGEVDIERLQVIEDLQGEIAATDRAIADRQREIEEVSAAYQADIERFTLLLEVVELRRKLLAQERQEQE
jgi:vacuolar-type H+-ATPase subunit I/STV1